MFLLWIKFQCQFVRWRRCQKGTRERGFQSSYIEADNFMFGIRLIEKDLMGMRFLLKFICEHAFQFSSNYSRYLSPSACICDSISIRKNSLEPFINQCYHFTYFVLSISTKLETLREKFAHFAPFYGTSREILMKLALVSCCWSFC